MTNPKRWPIGLQSSTTGDPQGIGEVIKELTDNNIAFFSASSDSTSILGDLQAARERRPEVPHTGNYIPTGYVGDYHLSVPEYGKPANEEMAVRHWDMVEKKVAINNPDRSPISWETPCLWISTWNEIRPYVGWARLEGEEPEQPVEGYAGNADLVGWQAYYIGQEALERGYRWAAFGFAGGDPQEGFWDAEGVQAYLKLCAEHPDQLGVALHEYSHILRLDVPEKIGRFKYLHDACDRLGVRRPVIQIKEFGWEASKIPPRAVAMEQLVPVAEMYMEHPNIHGAAIWTVQEWQGSGIDDQVRGLIPYLGEAALRYAKEIPSEQPDSPVVVTPPQPPASEWPFSILKASREEAKRKHKVTTEEFGIDVSRWQGDRLNWSQLKKDGVRFAFLRVGSGKTTRDGNYERNVNGCLRSDIQFGNYFFLYEDVDMRQQARMFVQQSDWRSTLPPVLDVERRSLTAEQVKIFVDEFHNLVDSPPILIYTSANIWNNIVPKHETWPSRHPLWVAHYGVDTPALPHHWDRWTFFQPGMKKGLPGFPKDHPDQSDELDYNHFNGPLEELVMEPPVRVRDTAFIDYLPFDSPVGTPEQRRRKEMMYPGGWIDVNPFRNHYKNPSTGKAYFHTGNDLNKNVPRWDADKDAPVYAAADGEVTFAGELNVWGGVIVVKHEDNLFSRYGHVANMRVKRGDSVERGQLIAQVGQDALGGPFHLHFDISQTDVLETVPGHWPGNNFEALMQNYVDPKNFIDRHRPQQTDPPKPPRLKVPEKYGRVTAEYGLNFRSEPSDAGGQSTVIRALPMGTRVGIYTRLGDWYHARVGDTEGFLWAEFISLEEPDKEPEPVCPKTGSVIGVHGAPGHGAPRPEVWDQWTKYLKDMGVRWYKQCESSDGTGEGSIYRWVLHLKENGIEPIIRYQMSQQFPNNLEDKHFLQMERYAREGVHWAEIGNESNLGYEWQESWWKDNPPRMRWSNPEAIEKLARLWIEDATRAANLGAWPAFYAFGPTDWGSGRPHHLYSSTMFTDLVVKQLANHHREETIALFEEKKAWIAVHVAKYEKDFNYDPYCDDRNRPWDMALRGYEIVLDAFRRHFKNDLEVDKIPIISTEGGVFVPEHANTIDAYRLPANDEEHARQTVEMFKYVERQTPLIAMCPWCISEGSLIGWETDHFPNHGWFRQDNGHLHVRPVYGALKELREEKEKDEAALESAVEAVPFEYAVPTVEEPTKPVKTIITISLQVKLEVNGGTDNIEVKLDPGVKVGN